MGRYLVILNGAGMANYQGERGPGRATAMEWRRPGLSSFCKNTPDNNTMNRTMPRLEGELGEGGAVTQRRIENHNMRTSQGLTGNWVQSEGGKGESALARETAANAGMRCGA